jgi:hypothetical protein
MNRTQSNKKSSVECTLGGGALAFIVREVCVRVDDERRSDFVPEPNAFPAPRVFIDKPRESILISLQLLELRTLALYIPDDPLDTSHVARVSLNYSSGFISANEMQQQSPDCRMGLIS